MRFATILCPPIGSGLMIWIFPCIRRFRAYSLMRALAAGNRLGRLGTGASRWLGCALAVGGRRATTRQDPAGSRTIRRHKRARPDRSAIRPAHGSKESSASRLSYVHNGRLFCTRISPHTKLKGAANIRQELMVSDEWSHCVMAARSAGMAIGCGAGRASSDQVTGDRRPDCAGPGRAGAGTVFL
jgi:hypothetical protein